MEERVAYLIGERKMCLNDREKKITKNRNMCIVWDRGTIIYYSLEHH